MNRSLLGQWLLDGLLAAPEDKFAGRVMVRVLRLVRRAVARIWDPLVRFKLDGRDILLPLSHNLPLERKRYPDYSTNLGRIAAAVATRHPQARAIDIGANVGDSAAIIRAHGPMPILCIEADKKFLRIFERNLPSLGPEVYLFAGFVAMATGPIVGETVKARGTSRLVPTAGDTRIEAQSLADILKRYPQFQSPRLLKIDTDGFDIPILRGALPFLQEVKPVLFFEYDPFYLGFHGDDGLRTLAELRKIGYSKALVYDNVGDLMLAADLDSGVLEDLHAYFSGRKAQRYMDLALFADDDVALWESLHRTELDYFTRRYSP